MYDEIHIARNSICPKSWKIFGLDRDQNITNLITVYLRIDPGISTNKDATVRFMPLSFTYSGYVDYYLPTDRGYSGRYWTTQVVANDNGRANVFGFSSDIIELPSRPLIGNRGFALRCVAR